MILFNRHNIKLPFKCLSLYPNSTALSPHQRSLFLQRMAIDTETHKWTMYRDCRVLSPKRDSHVTLPISIGSRNNLKETGRGKLLRAKCWESLLQTVSSQYDTVGVLVKSQQPWLPPQGMPKPVNIPIQMGLLRPHLQLRRYWEVMDAEGGGVSFVYGCSRWDVAAGMQPLGCSPSNSGWCPMLMSIQAA